MSMKKEYDATVLVILQSDGERIAELEAERDELRQQLAERDAEVKLLRDALLAVKPLMIPGVTWADSIGEFIKQMVREALAATEPKEKP